MSSSDTGSDGSAWGQTARTDVSCRPGTDQERTQRRSAGTPNRFNPFKKGRTLAASCRTSRHDLSLSEQLQPKALPDWSREGTEILPCLNIRSGECPELSSLQDQTWALAQPHARQAGFVWFISFLHPSLIRFARFVFWAARALCEKPRWITRWNVTAFGILNCFILVTRFALRRNKADVVETQLVGAPSWRAYDRYLHVLIYYWEKMKISKHSYRQW